MKICLICEGSYPYVSGGVSSWVQMICKEFKDIEFKIWAIATTREEMSEYKYQLPDNVKEVKTIYLGDGTFQGSYKKVKLPPQEKEILKKLVTGTVDQINWKHTLEFIKAYRKKLVPILMSEDFHNICLEEYERKDSKKVFSQYLWSFRSMYFPLMDILSGDIIKADIYHTVSTGYAGILGSAASYITGKPFILSEHGIYTREREEDIIRSNWVEGEFKELWIEFFKKLSLISYHQAQCVTSLFDVNKTLQVELGCPEEMIRIIPNGVDPEGFGNLKSNQHFNEDEFNIAAVLRVVPIKDIKTMILSFDNIKEQVPEARLYLMGNYDEDREYYEECRQLIEHLDIQGITFLGQVNVKEYLAEADVLLLTSISEGQPLAVLEGMAAGIPYVCTNVGNCRGLLEGEDEDDTFGRAGIVVPVMDCDAIADAVVYCYNHPEARRRMGKVGKERINTYYRKVDFLEKYRELYKEMGGEP